MDEKTFKEVYPDYNYKVVYKDIDRDQKKIVKAVYGRIFRKEEQLIYILLKDNKRKIINISTILNITEVFDYEKD